jgi:hypothetical protein
MITSFRKGMEKEMKTLTGYECIEDLVNSQIVWNGERYSPSDLLTLELNTLLEIRASIALKLKWKQEMLNQKASVGKQLSKPEKAKIRHVLTMIQAHSVVIKNAVEQKRKYLNEQRHLEKLRIKEENIRRSEHEALVCEGIAKSLYPNQIVFQYYFFLAAKDNLPTDEYERICQIAGKARGKAIGRCPA